MFIALVILIIVLINVVSFILGVAVRNLVEKEEFSNQEECYRRFAKTRDLFAVVMFLGSVIIPAVVSVVIRNIWIFVGGVIELASILGLRFVYGKIDIVIDNKEFETCYKYPHWWETE